MERKMFTLTEQQLKKCHSVEMPSDDEIKQRWMKSHHGKLAGWGMGKRDWIVSNMKFTPEYQRGLWQGRMDKQCGLPYAEERNDNLYNLGYYRGYTDWGINGSNGFDQSTLEKFMAQCAD